eukprot:COSAG03_NODE_13984_length_481_cov_0.740838_2_plen_34_part_01
MALILGGFTIFGGEHKMALSPKDIIADSPAVTTN